MNPLEFTRAYQKKIPFVSHLKILTEELGSGGGARLLAEARVLKDTKSMTFVEAQAKNEDGSLVAKAIATVRARHAKP